MSDKKILVADDESHILNVVSLKLRNAGFTVFTAGDGQEAYEIAVREKPNLLITDFHMPMMTGLELCAKMKANPETANIRAIMLSARGYDIERGEMEKSGILRTLSKPFSPRALLATVDEVLAA